MNLNESKKILILGCSGGGKSTLTRILCKKLELPAIHLDVHFWKPEWIETPRDKWREEVKELIKGKEWIMDGTFSESFDIRFPTADKIIVINLPRLTCLYRAIMRVLKYNKNDRRPDMADGCDEAFNLNFYKYIWTYNKKVYPKVMKAIEDYQCKEKVVYLKSNKDVSLFLKKVI